MCVLESLSHFGAIDTQLERVASVEVNEPFASVLSVQCDEACEAFHHLRVNFAGGRSFNFGYAVRSVSEFDVFHTETAGAGDVTDATSEKSLISPSCERGSACLGFRNFEKSFSPFEAGAALAPGPDEKRRMNERPHGVRCDGMISARLTEAGACLASFSALDGHEAGGFVYFEGCVSCGVDCAKMAKAFKAEDFAVPRLEPLQADSLQVCGEDSRL
jgi:hypothetical protein